MSTHPTGLHQRNETRAHTGAAGNGIQLHIVHQVRIVGPARVRMGERDVKELEGAAAGYKKLAGFDREILNNRSPIVSV